MNLLPMEQLYLDDDSLEMDSKFEKFDFFKLFLLFKNRSFFRKGAILINLKANKFSK